MEKVFDALIENFIENKIGISEFFLSKNSVSSDYYGYLVAIFLFILVPILSFFIPYIIKKTFKINKVFLYIFHIITIVFSILLFFHIALTISISHWFNF